MTKLRFIAPLALLTLATAVFAQDHIVSLAGVRVVAQEYGTGFDRLRPFNSDKGSSVALLVKAPEGGLISFEKDKSKIEVFADDKGKKLIKKIGFKEGFDSFPKISKDGKAFMVGLTGQYVPTPGATHIHAKGELALYTAKTKETVSSPVDKVAKGTVFKVGDYEFTLSDLGKPSWGKMPFKITLKTNKDITKIAKFVFKDKAGKVIESKSQGGSTFSGMGMMNVTRNFNLGKKVAELSIELEVYTDLKLVKVPFDVKAKLGTDAGRPTTGQ